METRPDARRKIAAGPPAEVHEPGSTGVHDAFDAFAGGISKRVGHPFAFVTAAVLVVAWALSGPLFGFSDTWQLVINTSTTVLTFLMVFVIQNTINRDSMALHLKLDELIRVTAEARHAVVGSERLPERVLLSMEEQEERGVAPSEEQDR